MEFSRQESWSGLPFPSPGDLPDPGIEPGSPALQADSLQTELLWKPCSLYGLAKSLFDFFYTILQKNLNQLFFDQPNIWYYSSIVLIDTNVYTTDYILST